MRIILIGCGAIGRMYAALLSQRHGAALVLYDVDSSHAREAAEASGGAVAESFDRAVDGADAAVVAASTVSHPDLVGRLLDRRVPTLCEKPLALDAVDTARLGAAADRSGTPLWVGFQRRFDPEIGALRADIADGKVGTPYLLRLFSHDPHWPPIARLAASGSIFTDLMLHDFDLARWWTGQEVTSVWATGSVLAVPELRELSDFDIVAAAVRFASGTLAVLTAGRHHPTGYDVRAEVVGSRDCVTIGLGPRTPVHPARTEPAPDAYRDYRDRFATAYAAQLDRFLAAVTGEAPDARAGGWRDSLAALRLAAAAEESARSGVPVPVAPTDDRAGPGPPLTTGGPR